MTASCFAPSERFRKAKQIFSSFLLITLSVFQSKSPIRNMFSQHCNSSIANSRLNRLKYKGRLFHLKTIFASITPVVSTSR